MTMNPRINKRRLARHIHDAGFVKPKRRVHGDEEAAALRLAREHEAAAAEARKVAAQARARANFEARPETWKERYRNLPLRRRAELYQQALGRCVLVSDKRQEVAQIADALTNFVRNVAGSRGLRGSNLGQPPVFDPRTGLPKMRGSII